MPFKEVLTKVYTTSYSFFIYYLFIYLALMGGPVLKEVREDNPDIDTSQEGDAGEEKGTPSLPARLP